MNAIQHSHPPVLQPQTSEALPRPARHQAELPAVRSGPALGWTRFSPDQVRRGLALRLAFIALRAALARVFDPQHVASALDPRYLVYLGLAFVLGSVGLVYVGFTRWVKVDLAGWWIDRHHLRGDLAWGLAGVVAGAVLVGALAWAPSHWGRSPHPRCRVRVRPLTMLDRCSSVWRSPPSRRRPSSAAFCRQPWPSGWGPGRRSCSRRWPSRSPTSATSRWMLATCTCRP